MFFIILLNNIILLFWSIYPKFFDFLMQIMSPGLSFPLNVVDKLIESFILPKVPSPKQS